MYDKLSNNRFHGIGKNALLAASKNNEWQIQASFLLHHCLASLPPLRQVISIEERKFSLKV